MPEEYVGGRQNMLEASKVSRQPTLKFVCSLKGHMGFSHVKIYTKSPEKDCLVESSSEKSYWILMQERRQLFIR